MSKMTFKYYRALKSTLDMLANKCSKGILMYGTNTIEQTTFCKLIDLRKAAKRLLSCTSIEIRGIGHYLAAEKAFAAWLQEKAGQFREYPENSFGYFQVTFNFNLKCEEVEKRIKENVG